MVALALRAASGPKRGAARRPRPLMAALRSIGRLLSRVAADWRARQAIRYVESFDDAMLRDIGLPRGGIEDAVRNGRGHRR